MLPSPQKYRAILMFGAPGSGKGTQGKTLGSLPGFYHCACGDVFRALDLSTRLGQAFLHYSSRGELVPDEITVELWKVQIADRVKDHSFKPTRDYLVLDGIPRNVHQAQIMEDMIDVARVFHLSCPDRAALVERLKRRALKDNRFDDANEEVISNRLATYEEESKPTLAHYDASIVKTLDATHRPSVVLQQILQEVNSLPD